MWISQSLSRNMNKYKYMYRYRNRGGNRSKEYLDEALYHF